MNKTEWMQLDADARATVFSQFVETVEAKRLRVERERLSYTPEPKEHVLAYKDYLWGVYQGTRERWVDAVVSGDTNASFADWKEHEA